MPLPESRFGLGERITRVTLRERLFAEAWVPTMTPFAFLSWPARPGAVEERPLTSLHCIDLKKHDQGLRNWVTPSYRVPAHGLASRAFPGGHRCPPR